MAGERKLGAPAQAHAVDRGDHRQPEGLHIGEHALAEPRRRGRLGAGPHARDRLEIGAGEKAIRLAAAHDHRAHVARPRELLQEIGEEVQAPRA